MFYCVKCGKCGFFIDEIRLVRYNISITSEILGFGRGLTGANEKEER